jgi:hypothetical protein
LSRLRACVSPPGERPDHPVEAHAGEHRLRIGDVDLGLELEALRLPLQLARRQLRDERVPEPVELRPQRPRGIFMLLRGRLDGHDHVALDLNDPRRDGRGDLPVPALLDGEIAAVENSAASADRSIATFAGEALRITKPIPRVSRPAFASASP